MISSDESETLGRECFGDYYERVSKFYFGVAIAEISRVIKSTIPALLTHLMTTWKLFSSYRKHSLSFVDAAYRNS